MKDVTHHFADLHPNGIHVYVLNESLQGEKKIPKWDPRARAVIYLGQSTEHAANASYVLNPKIGHIGSQYHLVYDNDFSTVKATEYRCYRTMGKII